MLKNKQKLTVSHYFYLTPKRCGPYFLVQVGESFCSPDTVIPSHTQRYFELTYAISGSAVCHADNHAMKISGGDCFFSLPGEVHRIDSDAEEPLHFIFLAFYAKQNSRENRYIEFIKNSFSDFEARKIVDLKIAKPLAAILGELKNSDEYTSRVIRSRLEEILIECCRKIHNKPTLVYPIHYSDSDILTKDLVAYIDEHIEELDSATRLSDVFHYSLPNISKIFKLGTGVPIGKYISGKRMELANKLLCEGYSVTQVSEKLKYSSIHTFSRAYKTYFRTAPSRKKAPH